MQSNKEEAKPGSLRKSIRFFENLKRNSKKSERLSMGENFRLTENECPVTQYQKADR